MHTKYGSNSKKKIKKKQKQKTKNKKKNGKNGVNIFKNHLN